MPRITNATATTTKKVGRKQSIKKEFEECPPAAATAGGIGVGGVEGAAVNSGEQQENVVFHRKSERRRIARDIFLVFEEQPCRRKRRGGAGGGGGAGCGGRKRSTAQKPKFGHLMVEDPSSRHTKAGLLRDIKNEPKSSYPNDVCQENVSAEVFAVTAAESIVALTDASKEAKTTTTTTTTIDAELVTASEAKEENTKKKQTKATKAKCNANNNMNNINNMNNNNNNSDSHNHIVECKPIVIAAPMNVCTNTHSPTAAPPKDVTTKNTTTTVTTEKPADSQEAPVARVNPIFLWIKQDDTRIVEVRCEDYDKRNRIRITKTTNGWRAIPRTDPTTTKIVKILHTATPLMKVKREIYENNLLLQHTWQTDENNFNAKGIVIENNTNNNRQIQIPPPDCDTAADANNVEQNKQSFGTQNIVENIFSCNNKIKNDRNIIGVQEEVHDDGRTTLVNNNNSNSNNNKIKVKHNKNKKAKSKKAGKKLGRKSTKMSIHPKQELAQDMQPQQEQEQAQVKLTQHNLMEGHLEEECRGQSTCIQQMLHSSLSTSIAAATTTATNLDTIQQFSEMCISDDRRASNVDTNAFQLHSEEENVTATVTAPELPSSAYCGMSTPVSMPDGIPTTIGFVATTMGYVPSTTVGAIPMTIGSMPATIASVATSICDVAMALGTTAVATTGCTALSSIVDSVSKYQADGDLCTNKNYDSDSLALNFQDALSTSMQQQQQQQQHTTPVKEVETSIETKTYQEDQTPHLQLCPKTGLFLPTQTIITCDSENDEEEDGETTPTTTGGIVGDEDCIVNTFNTNFLSKDIFVDLANCDDDDDDDVVEHIPSPSHNIGVGKLTTSNGHINSSTSFDADTKNLKELLDEADLMQHCNDNANSDADIIDSIVKRSCENNLIHETRDDTLSSSNNNHNNNNNKEATFITTTRIENITEKDLMNSVLPQHLLDETVRDSPKCLSFNEAGEIEGLNGELFQTNHFMDTYEKDSSVEEVCLSDDARSRVAVSGKKVESTEVTALTSPQQATQKETNASDDVILEETPKDLSYKKREEVCPPSESRSQCAVTSSSDILKSPQQQAELPAIESTSEAIKNLILEQFIKLNAFNAIPTTNTVATAATMPVAAATAATAAAAAKQQLEPINLGKSQRELSAKNDCSNYAPSTNYIETVVIDDENSQDEEPMKKRIRNTVTNKVNKPQANVIAEPAAQKMSITQQAPSVLIDKDPDPLTQLQLLIRNTQWKVPDPILVPKDRLRAVLASPAREIPLLITTRPELRLPEAFAYPEIIQNPNILVISMAQLEAILKNEMEIEKGNSKQGVLVDGERLAGIGGGGGIASSAGTETQHQSVASPKKTSHNKLLNAVDSKCVMKIKESPTPQPPPPSVTINPTAVVPPLQTQQPPAPAQEPPQPAKCSHVENNLASDINAATLAVLNQMLWLPYFGQLSQEFLKTIKTPSPLGGKYASLLPPPPLYNPQHLGLQHLDEMYKNYMKQMAALKHLTGVDASLNGGGGGGLANGFPLAALGAFQPSMEAAVFQKMLQHQLANMLNFNPLATSAAAATTTTMPNALQGAGKIPAAHEMSAAGVEHMMLALGEEKKAKCAGTTAASHRDMTMAGMATDTSAADKTQRHHSNNNNSNSQSSTNHKNNATLACADNALSDTHTNFNKYAYMQQQHQQQQPHKQEIDNKPRLTCKSLSNLLEPSESIVPATPPAAVPVINLTNSADHVGVARNAAAHELAIAGHSNNNNHTTNSQITNATNLIGMAAAATAASAHAHTASAGAAMDMGMPFKSAKLGNKSAVSSYAGLNSAAVHSHELNKQRKRAMNYAETAMGSGTTTAVAAAASLEHHSASRNPLAENMVNAESNPALWHPLFGSNAKTGYSSPWQWTTVTATGE